MPKSLGKYLPCNTPRHYRGPVRFAPHHFRCHRVRRPHPCVKAIGGRAGTGREAEVTWVAQESVLGGKRLSWPWKRHGKGMKNGNLQ